MVQERSRVHAERALSNDDTVRVFVRPGGEPSFICLLEFTMRIAGSIPFGKAVALGLALATPLRAARRVSGFAGVKGQDGGSWSQQASSRRIRMARDFARDFHSYLTTDPRPEPPVVSEVADEIARNLNEAKRHLMAMRKKYARDQRAVTVTEEAEQKLTVALQCQQLVGARRDDGEFDCLKMMDGCNVLASQLDQICLQLDELQRKRDQQARVLCN
jgi:hypothetical protein